MFCARLFICALWSPAGKGLTSWLSFVVSSVSLSLSHWYPGSGVVLDCIDSWSLHHYLLFFHGRNQNDLIVTHIKERPLKRAVTLINIASIYIKELHKRICSFKSSLLWLENPNFHIMWYIIWMGTCVVRTTPLSLYLCQHVLVCDLWQLYSFSSIIQ